MNKPTLHIIMVMALLSAVAILRANDTHPGTKTEQSISSSESKTMLSAKELYAHVKQPTTPLEVLQNIKFVMANELLFRDEFYTEDNLKRFFAGAGGHRENPSAGAKLRPAQLDHKATRESSTCWTMPPQEDGSIRNFTRMQPCFALRLCTRRSKQAVQSIRRVVRGEEIRCQE